jgi:lysophospholipase L1-like esterase
MRRAVELLGIGLVIVALLAVLGTTGRRAPLPPRARVRLVGDSLALGLGWPLRGALARQTVVVQAKNGATTADLGPDARAGIIEADAVLISLGTNDAAAPDAAFRAGFAMRARAIVADLQARGLRVIWLAPPPMPFDTRIVRAGIAQSGAEVLEPPANLPRQPDRIHPTPEGFARWASAVARELQ